MMCPPRSAMLLRKRSFGAGLQRILSRLDPHHRSMFSMVLFFLNCRTVFLLTLGRMSLQTCLFTCTDHSIQAEKHSTRTHSHCLRLLRPGVFHWLISRVLPSVRGTCRGMGYADLALPNGILLFIGIFRFMNQSSCNSARRCSMF